MKLSDMLLLGGATAIGISLYAKRARGKNILEPEDKPKCPAPDGVYLAPPAGYRRARQDEVTAMISSQARASLSHNLGDLRGPFTNEQGRQFIIAVETHCDATKGPHKGASVFIQA